MTRTYVIAGSIKQNGKLVRGAAVVDVEATTEFDCELKALQILPSEAQWQRGRHAAEVWPLESPEGTRLALAAGLVKPVPSLAN